MSSFTLRRSVLYVSGANARALEKARTLPADCLLFDLEDAVAPEQKGLARDQLVAALRAGGYEPRERIVRVNGVGTEWMANDLAAIVAAAPDAICLPKVESPADVLRVAALLDEYGSQAAIWATIETPRAVAAAQAIALADPRVSALVMGTADLAKALGVPATPERQGLVFALSAVVLAARVAGVAVLDGVFMQLDDDAGLRRACEQGRALGFDGKTLIHPRQLEITNEVFAPDAAAIAEAERILAGWQKAVAAGKGVTVVDGRLVERLHAEEAERLLAIAEATASRAVSD